MINFILELIFLILLGIIVYIDFIKVDKELNKMIDLRDEFYKMSRGVYLVKTEYMNYACFDNKKNALEYKKMLSELINEYVIIEFFVLRNEFFEENTEDLPIPF